MKKAFILSLLVGLIASLAANVQAEGEPKDLQAIYEECGLGGLLFPRWPVGASVSNVIWDFGTTATTTGLSTPDACSGGKAKLASYIYQSYDSIEQDLAKGEGKYLEILALLSVQTPEKSEIFINDVRNKFRDVVARDDYSTLNRLEKATLVFDIVQSLV